MRNRLQIIFFINLLLYLAPLGYAQQIPQVPREIVFADLRILINEQARREIQLDVDALYRNPTFFRVKAERVALYMPIVERELKNAGVPEDFKYLVIQESSLIPDAVSTSNAVGFWQFKQGTAEEVFLRVDAQVDERKNIASSTKGAALYVKKHNNQFDNWMCALVSYQMGLGGAKAYFGNQYNGKKVVEIDRNSHWYFKKFLAHKIAFEGRWQMFASSDGFLEEARIQGPVTLKALAPRLGVTEDHLKEYNKWASKGTVPGDKPYSVFYIKQGSATVTPAVRRNTTPTSESTASVTTVVSSSQEFPKISGNQQQATKPNQIKVNDLDGIQAAASMPQEALARQVGLKERKLRKINDLEKGEKIQEGQYYYTEPKRGSAEAKEHIVKPGETFWSISQMYGMKVATLKAKNRMREDNSLRPGMILYLQDHRKRNEDIRFVSATELKRLMGEEELVKSMPQGGNAIQSSAPRNETPAPALRKTVTHTVATGETLFRLSQRYAVSVEDIKKWNNLRDNTIRVGQKLTIYQ
ncbi:LysM peptidoglycan-binding domain-containing protein [Mongoliitalea daihaiensis]|uniref:LysM peptidoglycan-binding domain-containing protein n=1 Tax=Mongoliitalea daihaiensis TaxID=2782006 RepID=UPI001F1DEC4B|nr:LysM peptidoglycan-binding domain-containing protein [Mongoliitalea daihaiensis]UJP65290.1 LysM peptidoglycan-binding domain-containing protein [Mongoliitalea daihaiensis]